MPFRCCLWMCHGAICGCVTVLSVDVSHPETQPVSWPGDTAPPFETDASLLLINRTAYVNTIFMPNSAPNANLWKKRPLYSQACSAVEPINFLAAQSVQIGHPLPASGAWVIPGCDLLYSKMSSAWSYVSTYNICSKNTRQWWASLVYCWNPAYLAR